MAVEFHGTEALLPPQVLTYADILRKNRKIKHNETSVDLVSSASGLSTPELGSTESDSEGDDFIADLAHQMANYMLQEDDENTTTNTVSDNSRTCDLSENPRGHRPRRKSVKPTPVPQYANNHYAGSRFNQAFADDQKRPIEVTNQKFMNFERSACLERKEKITESTQQFKSELVFEHKEHYHRMKNNGRACGSGYGEKLRHLGSSYTGSGMRAIFLIGSGSRGGSCGTGVFLPRGETNNETEPRKKSGGCSTVLIPARVLQALNHHFVNMADAAFSQSKTSIDSVIMSKRNSLCSRQNRNSSSQMQHTSPLNHEELCLPHEWTY